MVISSAFHMTSLLTGCGKKKKKIVLVLEANCVAIVQELHNHVNKQIFDHRAQDKTRHGGISG